MLKIGLTGGIGSGKSTVAKIFIHLGIPVFFSDDESKLLLKQKEVMKKIVTLFGKEVLINHQVDTKKLADIVFSNQEKIKQLNSVLHPLVTERYTNWLTTNSKAIFTIKETAILFESESYLLCDKIICVSCELETRIERVITRDKCTRESVLARVSNQWSEEQRLAKSDFIIYNNKHDLLLPQVLQIIERLTR